MRPCAPCLAVLCAAVVAAAWPAPVAAETTRFFTLEGLGHFLDGDPRSTAVSEDGAVSLPPQTTAWLADAAQIYSAAAPWQDGVAVAQVSDGQVLVVAADGRARPLFKPSEAMVTAMAAHGDGLLVAAGPPAQIYRIDRAGQASAFARPAATFVWDLAAVPGGGALAATGEPGGVVAIDGRGAVSVRFAPEQAHLRTLVVDPTLGVFVGGGERGIVYRSQADRPFTALLDTGHTEITALLVDRDAVVVAGVTGAAALVAEDAAKKGGNKGTEVRSQVVRVTMDGAAEVLAASTDEAIFALAADGHGRVLAATGAAGRDEPHGRLYRIDPAKHAIAMAYQSPSRRLTHLVPLAGGGLASVAAAGGRIEAVGPAQARTGHFLTQPFDAGVNARYGLATLDALLPPGTAASVRLRTGQTASPDATWSAWSAPQAVPGGHAAAVPPGRYVQGCFALCGTAAATPEVQRLRVAYLRQNLPPAVRDVAALRRGWALWPLPRDEAKAKVVGLAERPEEGRADESARRPAPLRARQVPDRGALALRWAAEDPNGDELVYAVWVRAAGTAAWTQLADHLEDPFITLRAASFADGHYQFRVRASDAPANPPELARADCRESRMVLIDQTPPTFGTLNVKVRGDVAEIRGRVADAQGPLVELTVAVDGAPPRPLLPEDGVLDGPEEAFVARLAALAAGEHTVVLRAVDEADNAATAAARVQVAAPRP